MYFIFFFQICFAYQCLAKSLRVYYKTLKPGGGFLPADNIHSVYTTDLHISDEEKCTKMYEKIFRFTVMYLEVTDVLYAHTAQMGWLSQ